MLRWVKRAAMEACLAAAVTALAVTPGSAQQPSASLQAKSAHAATIAAQAALGPVRIIVRRWPPRGR
jgi:hypothetical protein